MNAQGRRRTKRNRPRRGLVLLIVLIVVVALTFAAYTFSELMLTHYEAALHTGDQIQTQMIVESGVDTLRQFLLQDKQSINDAGGTWDNATAFRNSTIVPDEDPNRRGSVTLIAPSIDIDGNLGGVRYGLEDESARLNINTLLWIDGVIPGSGRKLLMGLPAMTEEIADAILDWLDDDDERREFGAETEHYSGLKPAYRAKNGPLDTVEELLLVRDVTPQLLFGLDINRNGVVDQNEMGGTVGNLLGAPMLMQTISDENGDPLGSMERGWSAYLTLYSQESNLLTSAGEPKININGEDLEVLHEELTTRFNAQWANFIVGYRQRGAYTGNEAGALLATGDLDLTAEGGNNFNNVLDLIGAKTQVRLVGADNDVVLQSPFGESIPEMIAYLPMLMDNVTTSGAPAIPGRININQAPRAIIAGIPGITPEVVDAIIQQREIQPTGDDPNRYFETWLLTEGVVTLDEMKQLYPFMCGGGSVYRTQVIGYFQGGGAASRVEVVIDAGVADPTTESPKVVMWRDVSHLGRGYPLEVLGIDLTDGVQ